jgi:hypothetical protein
MRKHSTQTDSSQTDTDNSQAGTDSSQPGTEKGWPIAGIFPKRHLAAAE